MDVDDTAVKETGAVPTLMQISLMRDRQGVRRMETRVNVYTIIKKSTILKKNTINLYEHAEKR